MVAGEIAKPGADADAERIERQKTQPAEQRPGAVGKAERHADDDGGKRDLRFAAQHPDQERDTDIDQELQAAANMARIDMMPESRAACLGLRPRVGVSSMRSDYQGGMSCAPTPDSDGRTGAAARDSLGIQANCCVNVIEADWY
ncbi:MAG: hypothetical protein ACXWJ8_01610 [Xanthobacteraceae bacterium]